ncbi:MAG: glycosyltransferase family 39 protein [Candidatus Lokiarchaeota archaeon]|nr:glycosyltransferase family 39 protein [Candidatus Lokiarchaeota archaeon]
MDYVGKLFSGDLIYTSEFESLYPPLFIYIISIFSVFNISKWSIGLPILLCDFFTAIIVWKIVYKVWKNQLTASISFIIYLINPICLYYTDYLLLNTSVFTFFLVISIYFLLIKNYYYATLFLSLSVMCKQFAIIFFPILLIFVIKNLKNDKIITKEIIRKMGLIFLIFVIPIILLSMPYIFSSYPDFPNYLESLLNIDLPYGIYPPSRIYPVDFTVPFYVMGTNNSIFIAIKFFLNKYLFLFISNLIIIIFYVFIDIDFNFNKNFLVITLIQFISMTIFFPRGMYKDYCVLFVPIMSIITMEFLKRMGLEKWKKNPMYYI